MTAIYRTSPPPFHAINQIEILRASETRLKNGIPVFYIRAGTQDLVKVELIFPAGMWQQPVPLCGSAASAMLQEGTASRSAKAIAELTDYYGAFLETGITHDFASVAVYSLSKHLEKILPLVSEIISGSVFPEEEWNVYLQNKRSQFTVSNQKVHFIARKKFSELLFGNDHPYGHNVTEADFDNLKKETVFDFYKKSYTAKDALVIASGNVTGITLQLIEKHFGDIPEQSVSGKEGKNNPSQKTTPGEHYIEKKDALQSAIRIGKMLFTKTHPDYPAMLVVNTILGGYFGSRLMANIREEKGYTYGIGSNMVSYTHGGFFSISTETGAEVTASALQEIYFELNRLRTEKVSAEELSRVKNYLLGSFLRSMDGPFALADRFKGIYFHRLGYDYYERFIETVKTITAEKILELANTYLKKEEMVELIVGKK